MKIIAVINDLFFEAKVRTTAEQLSTEMSIIKDRDQLMKEAIGGGISKIIFDLNFNKFDPIEAAMEIKARYDITLIGYLFHFQADLKKKAEGSFDIILPRSEFSSRLPELLKK